MESEAPKNCKDITLDFIIKENDPEGAAVEDDVSSAMTKQEASKMSG